MAVCLAVLVFPSFPVANADTKVPCLVFSGNAEKEHRIDLNSRNRITFNDNSMVISSSNDETVPPVELLYSLYHHLEVREAAPADITVGVEAIDAETESRIYVDSHARLLHLETSSETEFTTGIFDINGHLLMKAELNSGDAVTIEALSPGVYIAVATDGKIKLTLKFILN